MTNFITIVKYDGGMASYQVQNATSNGFMARLIKSNSSNRLPEQIEIAQDLAFKNGNSEEDSLINKLICTIKVNQSIENNVSFDFLS